MSRRKRSPNWSDREVLAGVFRVAPERARRLQGGRRNYATSARKRTPQQLARKLQESILLIDDAIRLLKDQYRRRLRQCGDKPNKQELNRHVQRWLSKPTETYWPERYFHCGRDVRLK